MSVGSDVVYQYDGSGAGLLCCVFDSFARREMPLAIYDGETEETTLFSVHTVETDAAHADRVRAAIRTKISPTVLELVRAAYLSDLPERELAVLRFLQLGFSVGPQAVNMLCDARVDVLRKAARGVLNEAHLLKGFVRFSDCEGVLAAEIEPKNRVLPLLATHFRQRLSGENFLIYDRTHFQALVCCRGQSKILPLEAYELPSANRAEQAYRILWQRFYDTVAIQERYNPKCRMSHMPKRYWGTMTEFAPQPEDGELALAPVPAGGGVTYLPNGVAPVEDSGYTISRLKP